MRMQKKYDLVQWKINIEKKMKNIIRRIGIGLWSIGFDPRKFISSIKYIPKYIVDSSKAYKQTKNSDFKFKWRMLPILSEMNLEGGSAKGHYFHQDLWAARKIINRCPIMHVDVGSRIDGFVSHLLTVRDVVVIDVRVIHTTVKGLIFKHCDFTKTIDESLMSDSVSSLHALEHFGLGRYGDSIDINGWEKGIRNLAKITKKCGYVYLGVPITSGFDLIEFNAQRIFNPFTIETVCKKYGLDLQSFSYVNDDGEFFENVKIDDVICSYGCGCFELIKSGDVDISMDLSK